MVENSHLLTVAEYFAGIGLVRMGLEPSGWQVVFANDFSVKKSEMFRTFFADACLHRLLFNMNGLSGEHSTAFRGSNCFLISRTIIAAAGFPGSGCCLVTQIVSPS